MEILISILPIIVIVLVWLYIMYRLRKNFKSNNFTAKQDEILSTLQEIKQEIKELKANNSEKKL